MRLVYKATGLPVKVGDLVTTVSHERVTISYFKEPHKAASGGFISVSLDNFQSREYYCAAVGAEWIEREDRGYHA